MIWKNDVFGPLKDGFPSIDGKLSSLSMVTWSHGTVMWSKIHTAIWSNICFRGVLYYYSCVYLHAVTMVTIFGEWQLLWLPVLGSSSRANGWDDGGRTLDSNSDVSAPSVAVVPRRSRKSPHRTYSLVQWCRHVLAGAGIKHNSNPWPFPSAFLHIFVTISNYFST